MDREGSCKSGGASVKEPLREPTADEEGDEEEGEGEKNDDEDEVPVLTSSTRSPVVCEPSSCPWVPVISVSRSISTDLGGETGWGGCDTNGNSKSS